MYRLIRKNALDYTLGRFKQFNANSMEGESHLFIFGDFNFRLNSASFIKVLLLPIQLYFSYYDMSDLKVIAIYIHNKFGNVQRYVYKFMV